MGQAKNRGTYEERVKQAQMPSFIKRLDITVTQGTPQITYDRSDLIESQCKFIDQCVEQLSAEMAGKDPYKLGGMVFWGNSEDFAGSVYEMADPSKFDQAFRENQDLFYSQYYATTNQRIVLSKEHCESVLRGTALQPIGASLTGTSKYTNFSVAVAYAWGSAAFTANAYGDLCPPEADPASPLYEPRFVQCVTEALQNMGVRVRLNWRPGYVHTEFIKEPA